jgi:hypothetical protein
MVARDFPYRKYCWQLRLTQSRRDVFFFITKSRDQLWSSTAPVWIATDKTDRRTKLIRNQNSWFLFSSMCSIQKEKVSIKVFLRWRRDIKGNGTVLCSPTTAGLWQRDAPTMEYKRQAKRQKKYIIFFVLNNALTWKRLCRCSIYVVNIILKQNKSTKHIIFHLTVYSFLYNPPFRIFQPI